MVYNTVFLIVDTRTSLEYKAMSFELCSSKGMAVTAISPIFAKLPKPMPLVALSIGCFMILSSLYFIGGKVDKEELLEKVESLNEN